MTKYGYFLLIFCMISCNSKSENRYGFYYWRTKFSLNETEKNLLEKSTSEQFYVRLYDIDKVQNRIQFLGKLNFNQTYNLQKQLVPVIFITNFVWISSSEEEKQLLCSQILQDVQKIEKQHLIHINEIQLDCDWTAQTQKEYFQFLQLLKKMWKKTISCTLRLHQVKDKDQTGIPPVDKTYLMCYSTTSPLENNNQNSILEVTTLKNYLSKLEDYPIKNMDFALPIYSWAIVTNHLGKKKLINAITKEDLQKNNFIQIAENKYKVPKDGFYFGLYLSKNFTLKVEQISEEDIQQVKKFIEQKINFKHQYIYYHLDSTFTKHYKQLFP